MRRALVYAVYERLLIQAVTRVLENLQLMRALGTEWEAHVEAEGIEHDRVVDRADQDSVHCATAHTRAVDESTHEVQASWQYRRLDISPFVIPRSVQCILSGNL